MKFKLKIDTIKILLLYLMVCGILSFAENKLIFNIVQLSFVTVFGLALLLKGIRLTSYIGWAAIFFSWCFFSLLWSINVSNSLIALRMLLQVLVIGILITSYVIDKGDIKKEHIINAIIIGALILAFRLFINTPRNDWGTVRIGTALGYNQNSLGLIMSFACICTIYKIKNINKKNWKKILLFIFAIIFVFITLMTGSRKALFLIVAGSSIYILSSIRKRRRIFVVLPIVIVLIISFYMIIMESPVLYHVIGRRIEDTLNVLGGNKAGEDTMGRINIINDAYYYFLEKPILGYGLGNYAVIGSYGLYAHNNYLELVTGVGAIGCMLYYSLLIKILCCFFYNWGINRKNCELEMTLLLCILIMDIAMVSYYHETTQLILSLIYIKYYLLNKEKKTNRQKQ